MPITARILFSGDVYSKTMTMTGDNPARFEAKNLKLLDVVIIVETNNMLLGRAGYVIYPAGVGDTVGFTMLNLSTLWFKNATAGSNGKISILGVKK